MLNFYLKITQCHRDNQLCHTGNAWQCIIMAMYYQWQCTLITPGVMVMHRGSNTTCNSSQITIFVSKKIENYGQKIKVLQMKDIQ